MLFSLQACVTAKETGEAQENIMRVTKSDSLMQKELLEKPKSNEIEKKVENNLKNIKK